MLPTYWSAFLEDHNLAGKECRLSESEDESGVGAVLFIFNEKQSADEERNFYPGIAVAPNGYVPVAGCSLGSGDPYFIKRSDGPRSCLYRVYHDAVDEAGYRADAIAVVLQNYEELSRYVER